MKKQILISLILLSSVLTANAQWVEDGSKISTADDVEITNTKANTEVKLHISNSDLSGYSVIRFKSQFIV